MTTLQGLTQTHWKQLDDILIIANNEQLIKVFAKIVKRMNGTTKKAMDRLNAECKLAKVE